MIAQRPPDPLTISTAPLGICVPSVLPAADDQVRSGRPMTHWGTIRGRSGRPPLWPASRPLGPQNGLQGPVTAFSDQPRNVPAYRGGPCDWTHGGPPYMQNLCAALGTGPPPPHPGPSWIHPDSPGCTWSPLDSPGPPLASRPSRLMSNWTVRSDTNTPTASRRLLMISAASNSPPPSRISR